MEGAHDRLHEGKARGRAIAWMFAAVNTVEPAVVEREMALILERDEPWFEARSKRLEESVHARLRQLSTRLGMATGSRGSSAWAI